MLVKKLFNISLRVIRSFFKVVIGVFSLQYILGDGKSLVGVGDGSSSPKPKLPVVTSCLDAIALVFDKHVLHGNSAVQSASGSLVFGTFIIFIFFGIFGVWAALAPLEGAVVAVGEVVSSSDRKIIQHLEGGIIKKILINAGDHVKSGQPIICLENSSSKSSLDSINEKLAYLYATRDRLVALRDEVPDVNFSAQLMEMKGIQSKEKIISIQKRIFSDHKAVFEGQEKIIENRIVQLKEQLAAAESAALIAKRQHEIAKDDIEAKRKLFSDGYISRTQMGSFESQYAEVEGRFFQSTSIAYNSKEKISESELQLKDLYNSNLQQISNELNNIEVQISEFLSKQKIALDIYERSVIKSPINGVVTDIRYHTEGGVISSGSEIMTITPEGDPLIIESKIPVNRIEEILSAQNNPEFLIKSGNVEGLRVRIRLTAYSSRNVGILEGIASKISADSIKDSSGGRYYYVKIVISDDELKKFNGLKMYPGMPAQVMIVTNSRTLLSYLFSPIISTMERSFRER